jgi:hypothetical protein
MLGPVHSPVELMSHRRTRCALHVSGGLRPRPRCHGGYITPGSSWQGSVTQHAAQTRQHKTDLLPRRNGTFSTTVLSVRLPRVLRSKLSGSGLRHLLKSDNGSGRGTTGLKYIWCSSRSQPMSYRSCGTLGDAPPNAILTALFARNSATMRRHMGSAQTPRPIPNGSRLLAQARLLAWTACQLKCSASSDPTTARRLWITVFVWRKSLRLYSTSWSVRDHLQVSWMW